MKTLLPRRRRATHQKDKRGFTLIEMAVVFAIIALIAAISSSALQNVKRRASVSEGITAIVNGLRRARVEALARGTPTAFVIDTVGKRWWALEAPNLNTSTFLGSFNPSAPGRLIASGSLPADLTFGPSTGFGKALPAPYHGIPTYGGSSPSPNLGYCSFCRSEGFGLIAFVPGSPVVFNSEAPASPFGQQFTLFSDVTGGAARTVTVALLASSGAVDTFEK